MNIGTRFKFTDEDLELAAQTLADADEGWDYYAELEQERQWANNRRDAQLVLEAVGGRYQVDDNSAR